MQPSELSGIFAGLTDRLKNSLLWLFLVDKINKLFYILRSFLKNEYGNICKQLIAYLLSQAKVGG